MKTYRALVQSGGGARGAGIAGMVNRLVLGHGVDEFDVFAGTSVGALHSALLAQAKDNWELDALVKRLRAIYEDLQGPQDIYARQGMARWFPSKASWRDALALLSHNSIYNLDPLARLIAKHIKPLKLKGSGKELRLGTVSLNDGEYKALTQHHPDVLSAIRASAAIPIVFPPEQLKAVDSAEWVAHALVDGGLRNMTPMEDALGALKDLGATNDDNIEIYVCLSTTLHMPFEWPEEWSVSRISARTLDILASQVYRKNLRGAERINKALQVLTPEQLEVLGWGDMLKAKFFVFEPDENLIDPLVFTPDDVQAAFAHGEMIVDRVMEAQ